jgi:hypothetical protein
VREPPIAYFDVAVRVVKLFLECSFPAYVPGLILDSPPGGESLFGADSTVAGTATRLRVNVGMMSVTLTSRSNVAGMSAVVGAVGPSDENVCFFDSTFSERVGGFANATKATASAATAKLLIRIRTPAEGL